MEYKTCKVWCRGQTVEYKTCKGVVQRSECKDVVQRSDGGIQNM